MVRPASTADLAIGSERNRSITPLDRSSVSPRLNEQAGDQPVDVVASRGVGDGLADGAAEHVVEQDKEHHRLDGRE